VEQPPLLLLRPRHRPRQFLQLQALRLPPLQDCLLNVRRQERQVEQPADEAVADLFRFGDLPAKRHLHAYVGEIIVLPIESLLKQATLRFGKLIDHFQSLQTSLYRKTVPRGICAR
jgi:hypothetical protein